jgi:hypothetical protein
MRRTKKKKRIENRPRMLFDPYGWPYTVGPGRNEFQPQ